VNPAPPHLSAAFQRLYCDPAVFAAFCTRHPVSLLGVLPLLTSVSVVDDLQLLAAEAAHLADRNDSPAKPSWSLMAGAVCCRRWMQPT